MSSDFILYLSRVEPRKQGERAYCVETEAVGLQVDHNEDDFVDCQSSKRDQDRSDASPLFGLDKLLV